MRTRIMSGVALAGLVLGPLLWSGGERPFAGWPFALLVLLLLLQGLREFYDGCRAAGLAPLDGFGFGLGALFLVLATPLAPDPKGILLPFALTALVLLSLVFETFRGDRAPLRNLAPMWLGALYVGWLFSYAARLHLLPSAVRMQIRWSPPPELGFAGDGAWLLLFALAVTAAGDTGAYFTGRALGRHPMAPELSPNKTWEGLAGGLACSVLAGAAVGAWLRLPPAFALAAAALCAAAAPLGDLAKSAIKREIGIKDFGTLIPGHGGVLDRFDSLLFTAPALYWLVRFWR